MDAMRGAFICERFVIAATHPGSLLRLANTNVLIWKMVAVWEPPVGGDEKSDFVSYVTIAFLNLPVLSLSSVRFFAILFYKCTGTLCSQTRKQVFSETTSAAPESFDCSR